MKWIEQQEKLLQVQNNFVREPINSIHCFFLYINLDNELEKITTQNLDIDIHVNKIIENNNIYIPKEKVLQLIQSNRIYKSNTKYIYQESFLFYIDLDSENLQKYIYDDNFLDVSKRFMKVLPLVEDIIIPPSIFIFHDLHSLYFVFKEVIDKTKTENKIIETPKSILKNAATRKKHCSVTFHNNLEDVVFNTMFNGQNKTLYENTNNFKNTIKNKNRNKHKNKNTRKIQE